jgi:hypothetical protein
LCEVLNIFIKRLRYRKLKVFGYPWTVAEFGCLVRGRQAESLSALGIYLINITLVLVSMGWIVAAGDEWEMGYES